MFLYGQDSFFSIIIEPAASTFKDKDTKDFINTYMTSKTRKSIDEAQAYVNTMSAKELWKYFCDTDNYSLKEGQSLSGFFDESLSWTS